MAEPAFPAQQHPTAPLLPLHTKGLLYYLGVTGLEEPWAVSTGDIKTESKPTDNEKSRGLLAFASASYLHRLILSDSSRLSPPCGTDKLIHTRGLELQNSFGDSIITVRWLHFERNLMKKDALGIFC